MSATTAKLGPLRRYGLACLTVSILSVGCHVVSHRQTSGRTIDRQEVKEIVPGTTTKQEITARFGKPDRTSANSDGTEQYVYIYKGDVEVTNEAIVWSKREIKGEDKRLRVVFGGDVVRGYAYTNSNVPSENLSQQVGSSEVYLATSEGIVDFTNDLNHVRLDVARGLAAKIGLNEEGALDVGIPDANTRPLRMRVRERFASANPGTAFTTNVAGDQTDVAVKQGAVVVRSRSGCETVDAGSHREVRPPESEAAATIGEISFPSIHYGFRSVTPLAPDAPLLECVADLLSDYPDARVRVEGHSDSIGSSGFNQRLSTGRAEAVRRALVANGITASRLEVMGYGRSRPLAPNDSEPGRARNRRVEFTLIGRP